MAPSSGQPCPVSAPVATDSRAPVEFRLLEIVQVFCWRAFCLVSIVSGLWVFICETNLRAVRPFRKHIEDLEAELAAAKKNAAVLEARAVKSSLDNEQLRETARRMVQTDSEQKAALKSVEPTITSLRNRNAELEAENTRLETQKIVLEAVKAELGVQTFALEAQISVLERQNAKLGDELEASREIAIALDRQNARIGAELEASQESAYDMDKQRRRFMHLLQKTGSMEALIRQAIASKPRVEGLSSHNLTSPNSTPGGINTPSTSPAVSTPNGSSQRSDIRNSADAAGSSSRLEEILKDKLIGRWAHYLESAISHCRSRVYPGELGSKKYTSAGIGRLSDTALNPVGSVVYT